MAGESDGGDCIENHGITGPLRTGIHGYLTNGQYSDLTITSGTRTWNVHKAIVCPQSEFFAKACNSGYKVGESVS
jgi:hypothetical protein